MTDIDRALRAARQPKQTDETEREYLDRRLDRLHEAVAGLACFEHPLSPSQLIHGVGQRGNP